MKITTGLIIQSISEYLFLYKGCLRPRSHEDGKCLYYIKRLEYYRLNRRTKLQWNAYKPYSHWTTIGVGFEGGSGL